nr:ABC transporter permease [bacterium]
MFIIAFLLFIYLPIIVVVVYSFNSGRYGAWNGFSLEWYQKLMHNQAIGRSLINSLQLALYSSFAAAIIGTAGAIGLARSRFRGLSAIENLAIMPMMIPEIVLGLAYMTLFSFFGIKRGMGTLVLAHTAFCIPYILINVQGRLAGMDPALLEAARDLGAKPSRAFCDITLPLIMPAVLSGMLLSFAMSMDDVVISFFVTGNDNTLPLHIYSMLKTGISPEINALCTLMLLVVLAVVVAMAAIQFARGRKRVESDANPSK